MNCDYLHGYFVVFYFSSQNGPHGFISSFIKFLSYILMIDHEIERIFFTTESLFLKLLQVSISLPFVQEVTGIFTK